MPGWLKTFGADVIKGLTVVAGIAPMIGVAVPKAAPVANAVGSDLEALFSTIQKIEVAGQQANMNGAQKLAMAVPIVQQQMMAWLQGQGFKVQDQNRWAAATTGLTSVLADIANAVEQFKAA